MMLTQENVGKFAELVDKVNETATETYGKDHRPVQILQLTHSGRYSRPVGHKMAPIICQRDPMLDSQVGIKGNDPVVADEYLESLPEHYASAAKLAQKAGFDGVDIKVCHRYLLSELLACHTREGKYGGCFENRTQLIVEIYDAIKRVIAKDFILSTRFNAYDAHPYPYGFGVKPKDGRMEYDSTEPVKLAKLLVENGAQLLGTTAGNPRYIFPYVTRAFDSPVIGVDTPDEHPLESSARLFKITRDIQKAVGNIPVVGSGYSWLRQYAPYAGAANLKSGGCCFIGLGRLSFAYPDAPRDILSGKMDPKETCTACSKCSQMMRDHGRAGCLVRDSELYTPLYKESRADAENRKKK